MYNVLPRLLVLQQAPTNSQQEALVTYTECQGYVFILATVDQNAMTRHPTGFKNAVHIVAI